MDDKRAYDVIVTGGRSSGENTARYARGDGSSGGTGTGIGACVPVVHRLGAIAAGAFVLVFGILGFAGGLAFLSNEGERILGMSSNGLLSAISVVTAVVLIGAAVKGPRLASTVMLVLGAYGRISGHLPRTARTLTRTQRPPPNTPCGRPRSPSSSTLSPPTSAAGWSRWRGSARGRAGAACGWSSTRRSSEQPMRVRSSPVVVG
jgi:hypothetical protein